MTDSAEFDIEASAMRMLAMREHSRSELAAKLAKKAGVASSLGIEAVLDDLVTRNLLSDERFAEQYVSMKVRKGYGPIRIRSELERLGISSYLIALFLDEADFDWQEQLMCVANSKFGDAKTLDKKEQAKRGRFLEYRGFPISLVRCYLWDE